MDQDLAAIMERVDEVERESFLSLYTDVPEDIGVGIYQDGPAFAMSLGSYDDSGFTSIFDLELAPDPHATFQRLREVLRSQGARTMSAGVLMEADPPMDEAWLRSEGFSPDYDEWICWRPLAGFEAKPLPDGVEIVVAGESDADIFARVLSRGWGDPDDGALGRVFGAAIEKPGWIHYLALVDGQPGSAAALFIADRVADCFVAGTVPEARRRGAQTALIERRLHDGRKLGCDIATAQAAADGASERNYRRAGFQELYRRTIWACRFETD